MRSLSSPRRKVQLPHAIQRVKRARKLATTQLTTINPFANYNFNGGWFVGASLVSTADWDASGEKWTLPVGLQGGRLIKIADKLPVNLLVGAYYNALRPSGAGTWQLRTQVTFVF